ncbi:MAG: DNA helicase RecQ [Bacteriovoracaceae bacterium]|jgi:ATP-dependent DNA helicase RecQ|nr:DNA helicase RecQ [Bacteriovoracaceae bacterium]
MRQTELKKILKEVYGHDDFRFDQLAIIESVLDKKDTIAIMPTGGGKSVCYQVPALYSKGVTIVVSPLISLMEDQVRNLSENGIASCYLNSEQSYEQKQEAKQMLLSGEVKIVYISPEGLLSAGSLGFLQELDISLIAIDEAHCVSQWGHEFRNDYRRLGELKETFPSASFLALTATADHKTRVDIARQLKMQNENMFVSSFDRPNITYEIHEREDELKQLDAFIKDKHQYDTGIVYCLSRKKVERITDELKKLGHDAYAYHAGMSSAQKKKTQKKFNMHENVIVVATIAFGMGIDRPDVRFVAHLDLPKSIEAYYQETGRAGRDGEKSSAWMVYGLQDTMKLSMMIESSEASEEYKKIAKFKLDAMLSLCETSSCRRQYLLSYFEQKSEACNNCDTCLYPVEKVDATVDAQKLLSSIFRTGQSFGAGHVIDVLRGSKNNKVLQKGHDKLSVYGIGSDKDKKYWSSLLRQLLSESFVQINNWEYRSLGLNEKSKILLTKQDNFFMRKQKVVVPKKTMKNISESHEHGELFEKLRTLRMEIAKEHQVPPYIIFGDKTLHDMCQILPRDKSEFLLVSGVGQSKLERYGDEFLNEIRLYLD